MTEIGTHAMPPLALCPASMSAGAQAQIVNIDASLSGFDFAIKRKTATLKIGAHMPDMNKRARGFSPGPGRSPGAAWAALLKTSLVPCVVFSIGTASLAAPLGVTDLGALPGGSNSFGVRLNASGQVTGYSDVTPTHAPQHGFVTGANGVGLTDIGTLGGLNSTGYGINDAGQVTGAATNPPGPGHAVHGFVYATGVMTDLGTLGGRDSAGYAINASGRIAGSADTAGGALHAFVANGTTLQDLGTLPGGSTSEAFDINAAGQLTGYSNTASSARRAFITDGSILRDIGTLGGTFSEGMGINSSGQVIGDAGILGDVIRHAFISGPDGGALHDLGTLAGGVYSAGNGVNASGQVVGYGDVAGGAEHGFLYSAGSMLDLNALIDPAFAPYVTMTSGLAINDAGWIVANGHDSRTGQDHAYLLTNLAAVPEPSALGLMSLGLAVIGLGRRLSKR